MEKKMIIDKISLPIIYISIWVALYLLPRQIFHVGGDNRIEPWLIFLVVFIILPYIFFTILRKNEVSYDISKGLAYGSVFLVIPFFLFMESEDTKELNEYRVETIGVVSKAWMVRQRKKIDTWNVKAKYQVDGKVYETTSKNDEDMTLTMGDTITVIYSSKTPEMSEIKELEEYYGK